MENMGNYILNVLKTSPMVLFSWGACGFRELEDNKGLSMIVNGFIYKGKVLIEYNEGADAFDVIIGETIHNHIYIDMLVEFIDSVVEKNCNDDIYKEKVDNFLETVLI